MHRDYSSPGCQLVQTDSLLLPSSSQPLKLLLQPPKLPGAPITSLDLNTLATWGLGSGLHRTSSAPKCMSYQIHNVMVHGWSQAAPGYSLQ